ncbi:hypothetical protein [Deferribacter desulfuricans]|uniref:hypothetical protein n=1 Tax=Deferribacter desulfuricans TaxID=197162 RepID=UPI0002EAA81B|nr:hypothetical protein [Deferribacter desulfuricans]
MKNNSFKHFIGIDIFRNKYNYTIIVDSMNTIIKNKEDIVHKKLNINNITNPHKNPITSFN